MTWNLRTFKAFISPASIDDCWIWDGDLTFTTPAQVCLELHGITGGEITHTCGNYRCVNPRHLRVDGRYVQFTQKLCWLSPEERFWWYSWPSDGCRVWRGSKVVRRDGVDMHPHVYLASLCGVNCKAPDVTITCGNPRCVLIKHIRVFGQPLPPLDDDQKFWSYIRRNPSGCWIWLGKCTVTGVPRVLGPSGYRSASAKLAKLMGLNFSPRPGAKNRTCGHVRCLSPKHFIDHRTPKEKFHASIRKSNITGGTRCWIWLGPNPSRCRDIVPELKLRSRVEVARVSLYLNGQGFHYGKLYHRCGCQDCVRPNHLGMDCGEVHKSYKEHLDIYKKDGRL